jgi:hypothetical protein
MKTIHWILLIVVGAIALFTVMEVESCVKEARRTEVAEQQGLLLAHQKALKAAEKKREKIEQEAQLEIDRLTDDINEKKRESLDLREQDRAKAVKIRELEAEMETMEIPTEIEQHPAYINMVGQRDEWESRYYTMEDDRDKWVSLYDDAMGLYDEELRKGKARIDEDAERQKALDTALDTIDSTPPSTPSTP